MASSPGSMRSGLMYIKMDGIQYDLQGDLKYKTGSWKREAIVGSDKVHGYKETVEVPYVEATITDSGLLNNDNFKAMRDVTVTIQNDNGKTVIFRNAWCVQAPEIDAGECKVPLRFEALEGKEVPRGGNSV